MSDLVCVAFDDIGTADKLLDELQALSKEYLVDLEDAVVVTRDQQGKVKLHQAVNLAKMGAVSGGSWGALWGTLIGVLFAQPLAGLLVGAAAGAGGGALGGALSDYGIDDDFVKSLGQRIKENSSALFVLVRKVNADKVLPEISKYQGTVLRTSLSNEQEEKLREALRAA